MKKSKWGHTPPQTQVLTNGKIRVYLNIVEETESNIYRDENDELQTVTTPVYIADEIDIDAPLTYDRVAEALIRDRYSVSDELAILRQQSSKPEEFEAYNEYAETCKTWAKSINY